MLQIKILKTYHTGEQHAKKLIPHINACNAFSMEAAATEEYKAAALENQWNRFISSGMSRTHFLGYINDLVPPAIDNEEKRKYVTKAFDYMFRSGAAMYYDERWGSEAEAQEVLRTHEEGIQTFTDGYILIMRGQEEAGIEKCYEGSQLITASQKRRDTNIAQNIKRAEGILRSTYPRLKGKDPIILALQLGSNHKLESHLALPAEVSDLHEDKTPAENMDDKINEAIHAGARIEEVEPLFVELVRLRQRGIQLQEFKNS